MGPKAEPCWPGIVTLVDPSGAEQGTTPGEKVKGLAIIGGHPVAPIREAFPDTGKHRRPQECVKGIL